MLVIHSVVHVLSLGCGRQTEAPPAPGSENLPHRGRSGTVTLINDEEKMLVNPGFIHKTREIHARRVQDT
jgi:hypothetical protein